MSEYEAMFHVSGDRRGEVVVIKPAGSAWSPRERGVVPDGETPRFAVVSLNDADVPREMAERISRPGSKRSVVSLPYATYQDVDTGRTDPDTREPIIERQLVSRSAKRIEVKTDAELRQPGDVVSRSDIELVDAD